MPANKKDLTALLSLLDGLSVSIGGQSVSLSIGRKDADDEETSAGPRTDSQRDPDEAVSDFLYHLHAARVAADVLANPEAPADKQGVRYHLADWEYSAISWWLTQAASLVESHTNARLVWAARVRAGLPPF